jgi:hypothetical protein
VRQNTFFARGKAWAMIYPRGSVPPSSRVFSSAETSAGTDLPAEVTNRLEIQVVHSGPAVNKRSSTLRRPALVGRLVESAAPLKHDHLPVAPAGKRSSRCVLFVPVAEVKERLPVASHD